MPKPSPAVIPNLAELVADRPELAGIGVAALVELKASAA